MEFLILLEFQCHLKISIQILEECNCTCLFSRFRNKILAGKVENTTDKMKWHENEQFLVILTFFQDSPIILKEFRDNSKAILFLRSEFLNKCLPGRRWWIGTSRRRQSFGLFVTFVLNLVRFQTFANSFILVFSRTGVTARENMSLNCKVHVF